MVTNLPQEAKAKFAKYQEARTPEEKLQALKEFISAVPKHKGTEGLLYWAKRRMAELKEEIEERKSRKRGSGGPSFFIEREGAAQIVMLGLPNSGKTSILARVTNASAEPSDIPFSTKLPKPGMLQYQDIQFQLIDTPSIMPESNVWSRRVIGLARNADAIMVVVDLSNNPLLQLKQLAEMLSNEGIKMVRPRGMVEISKTQDAPGVRVIYYGKLLDGTSDDVRRLLESYRIYKADVKIYGEVTLSDIEESILGVVMYKPTIVVANKLDLDPDRSYCKKIARVVRNNIPVLCVSALTGEGLDGLGDVLFKLLNIVRIYTKPPNGEVSKKPLIVKGRITVLEAAKLIHKDLYRGFKYAKIWGPSAKYPGERVGGDHLLMDGDIIEIHT